MDADVIIAGAGMAGATLALSLTQAGLKAVLIDPQLFATQLEPTFDGRASAIAFASFRQWRTLGLAPALEPASQRIEQILVTDGRSPGASAGAPHGAYLRFDAAEIAERTENEPLGYMVENRQIRAALAQAVLDAEVKVLAPEKVAALEIGPGSAGVTLASGRRLSAPLVVGADGRGSLVRRAAGIGEVAWPYAQVGVVATVGLERPHEGVAHEHFLPAGPFAILPLTDQRASLVWTEKKGVGEALKTAPSEAFHAHLARRFGPFVGRVERLGPTFVYPLSLAVAEAFSAPRTALLGDAAHTIHPIAGQGLNLGLKGAAALAEVVVEAARRGEDIGDPAVLARYDRWRRTDVAGLALATDLFNRLFSTDHPLVRLARDAGMAAVNRIQPAKRFFMHEAGGAVGDLPRLLRGQAL